MNSKYFILVLMAFLLGSYAASAQKGNNLLQLSGSVAIPTGELSKVVDVGYGVHKGSIWRGSTSSADTIRSRV